MTLKRERVCEVGISVVRPVSSGPLTDTGLGLRVGFVPLHRSYGPGSHCDYEVTLPSRESLYVPTFLISSDVLRNHKTTVPQSPDRLPYFLSLGTPDRVLTLRLRLGTQSHTAVRTYWYPERHSKIETSGVPGPLSLRGHCDSCGSQVYNRRFLAKGDFTVPEDSLFRLTP